MQIAVEKVGDVAVAAVPVEELDASNAGEFKRDMAPVLDVNAKLVLDLSRLRFVDSSGLGAFISCLRKAERQGRRPEAVWHVEAGASASSSSSACTESSTSSALERTRCARSPTSPSHLDDVPLPDTSRLIVCALPRAVPAARGNDGPDRLDEAERPGPLQEPVHGSEHARDREAQNETRTALLERVTHHHQRDGAQPEQRELAHNTPPARFKM